MKRDCQIGRMTAAEDERKLPPATDVRRVEEKVGPRAAIDGLIVEAWGLDEDRLRHVTVWESKALVPARSAACSRSRRHE